jgi:uncharacterized protein YhdP
MDSHEVVNRFGLPAANQVQGDTNWQGDVVFPHQIKRKWIPTQINITSDLMGVLIDLPHPVGKSSDEKRDFVFQAQVNESLTNIHLDTKKMVSGGVQLDTSTETIYPTRAYLHFGKGKGAMPVDDVLHITGSLEQFRIFPWIDALKQGDEEVTHSFIPLPLSFDMASLQLAAVNDESEDTDSDDGLKLTSDKVPVIRGKIAHLAYDDVKIGQVEFETSRMAEVDGMLLDKLVLKGEQLNLDASGVWREHKQGDSTTLDVKLHSPDLGKMLTKLGFSAILQGGETDVSGTLRWPGNPIDVRLSNIEGELYEQVRNGSIVSVEPGAGRLLGLFSLSALPRRLMLDFSDAFGEGLSFDTIEGDMTIRDGNVFLDNNVLKSPLALVTIDGRTGLVDQDFDQLISVIPQGGDALSVQRRRPFGALQAPGQDDDAVRLRHGHFPPLALYGIIAAAPGHLAAG